MAVDQGLVARIRGLVGLDPRVTEQRMFGGICFLLEGRILVGARHTGGLLVQCGAAAITEASATPGVGPMIMAGRAAKNFIEVEGDAIETDEGLGGWIALADRYLASLPPRA